jgi:uncharacterized protein (TIGR00369 family)
VLDEVVEPLGEHVARDSEVALEVVEATHVDFSIPYVEEGRIAFSAPAAEWMLNPLGTVHGGVIATMLDSAVACAVHTTVPAGIGYTTLEIKVSYLRPVPADAGNLIAAGEVVHRGGTVATAEGRLTAESDGRLFAHATTTCMILRPR